MMNVILYINMVIPFVVRVVFKILSKHWAGMVRINHQHAWHVLIKNLFLRLDQPKNISLNKI